jgi:hypothetical protein
MSEGSWVGLDVHARSVVAGVIDQGSGEVRSLRVAPGNEGTVAWLNVPLHEFWHGGNVGLLVKGASVGASSCFLC